ncbi:unnamed protein product [Amoebophrya sp. A25]|nr:unnamed protein product [Amoebophrya sp. A25]|eukprot:GSA25T00013338001.1
MGDQLLLHWVTQPATVESLEIVESLLEDRQASIDAKTATGSGVLYERILHWDNGRQSCSSRFERQPMSSRCYAEHSTWTSRTLFGASGEGLYNASVWTEDHGNSCSSSSQMLGGGRGGSLYSTTMSRDHGSPRREQKHLDGGSSEELLMEMVRVLLKYRADVNSTDKCARQSCLQLAVQQKNIAMVAFLLAQPGIDVGFRNRSEQTVWHLAVMPTDLSTAHSAASGGGGSSASRSGGGAVQESFAGRGSASLRLLQALAKHKKAIELVDSIDADGHNAAYWAREFGVRDCLDFLRDTFKSVPRFFTGADVLAMMLAAKEPKKEKKKAGGGKKKK